MHFHNILFKIDNFTVVITVCLYVTWVCHSEKLSQEKILKKPGDIYS